MAFTDTQGRTIEIACDYEVEAFHDGKRIGYIDFDDRDGITTLIGMDVDEDYRWAGIATAMMREAAEMHGPDFSKPSFQAMGGRSASADSYYTPEGAAFIKHCINLGILDDTEPRDEDAEDPD